MDHKKRPIIAYDANHHLHKGPASSAENPDRVSVIVGHLKNTATQVDWHVMESAVMECTWSDKIQRNCSACTFELNTGSNICPMCDSVVSDSWNYVQD